MEFKVVKEKKKLKQVRSKSIVTSILERVNISADMFERYKDIIIDMISGNHGVYALYYKNKLYYVGLATDFKKRITTHTKNRHQGKWDQFSLYIIRKQDHIKELESLLLRIANPSGNRQQGKLKAAKNMRRELVSVIDQQYKYDKKMFLGNCSPFKHRVTRKAVDNKSKTKPLKGLFDRNCVLYATYKGVAYKAWVFHRTGTIKYKGELFDSPSEAGRAVRKKATNGWHFWKYRNRDGELVKLASLRI